MPRFPATGRMAAHPSIAVDIEDGGTSQKSDHALFHRWYHSIMAFLSNLTQDPEVAEQGLRTKDELQAYMLPIIAERRATPGDDLLSVLCTAAPSCRWRAASTPPPAT